MELTYTIDGVTLYTKAPKHLKGCSLHGFKTIVTDEAVRFVCKGCGVFVSVDRNMEPEEVV